MPISKSALPRFPRFYSRIGFDHEFHTLEEKEITELLNQGWVLVGVTLPSEVLAPDVIASLIRMSGRNFRRRTRLLAQIERILKVNQLDKISKEIVAAGETAWSSDRSDLRKVPAYANVWSAALLQAKSEGDRMDCANGCRKCTTPGHDGMRCALIL